MRFAPLVLLISTLPAFGQDYPDKTKLLVYREGAVEHPVRTPADWEKRRAHILANLQRVMGPMPTIEKVPLDIRIEGEIRTDKFIRRKLTYAAGPGNRVSAFLFLPLERVGKTPGILCLHPTSKEFGKGVPAGLTGKSDRHYAVHLAERGYVTLAPDYVHSGEYQYDPYEHGFVSATMLGIWNHRVAVDLLQSMPEVDGANLGVVGHSLGGHNSMFVAAFDPRLKAIVSNCGFCSFPTYMKGSIAGWSHKGYMPRLKDVYNLEVAKVPFDFPEVVAALAPRAFLASAPVRDHNFDVQGVKDCLAAARPVYQLLGAGEKLQGIYPDAAHDFPDDARAAACAWFDRWLKGR